MKVQLLGQRLALAAALGATATIAVETGLIAGAAAQQKNQFYCDTSKSPPTTIVRSPGGKEVPLIRWISSAFADSSWTPARRCETVSLKLQELYSLNKLKYITTGIMKDDKMKDRLVVCTANRKNGDCVSWLFMLKPGSNPTETLQKLTNLSSRSAGDILNESSGERLYIDIEEFIKTATVAKSAKSNSTPQFDNLENCR